MTSAEIFVSLKDPEFYHCWRYLDKFRHFAEKANPDISYRESAERCFAYYLLGKGLEWGCWEDDAELAERIIGSKSSVAKYCPNTKILFNFGQLFRHKDKGLIAIIAKEAEQNGVAVEGEPLGRGFRVEIRGSKPETTEFDIKKQMDLLVNFIRKYSKAAKIQELSFAKSPLKQELKT